MEWKASEQTNNNNKTKNTETEVTNFDTTIMRPLKWKTGYVLTSAYFQCGYFHFQLSFKPAVVFGAERAVRRARELTNDVHAVFR